MSDKIYPIIKWAGGKRRLASKIADYFKDANLIKKGHTYFEPFLGGGALLFFLQPDKAVGIDQNPELINFYEVVNNKPEELYRCLQDEFYHQHSEEFYYQVLDWDRSPNFGKRSDVERAARFIYLNKSCFNGIWRVNSKGENNVPWNHQNRVSLPTLDKIMAVHNYLKKHLDFYLDDYKRVLEFASKGDFVYFDPPYDVEPQQSSFTAYTKNGFGRDKQKELKELCDKLLDKGVSVAVSNSNTEFIRNLYNPEDEPRKYVYKILNDDTLRLSRNIAGKSSCRRQVNEALIIGKPKEKRKKK